MANAINIFSYLIIASMVVYLLDAPYLWKIIVYVIGVIVTEIILIKKKK